jgi:hypothetical protein
MSLNYVLAFTEDVVLDFPTPAQAVIETDARRTILNGVSPELARASTTLSGPGADEDELVRQVAGSDGESDLARIHDDLALFTERRMIR